VRSVALLPSIAVLSGALAGSAWAQPSRLVVPLVASASLVAVVAWVRQLPRVVIAAVTVGYVAAGFALAASAACNAMAPMSSSDVPEREPVHVRARLLEDAAVRDAGVTLLARVGSIGIRITVSGDAAGNYVHDWRAGRVIAAPVTLRRPARYLNEGVPDFARDLALDGVALLGSVKSGLQVEVVEHATPLEELAADLRARVRRAIARYVGARDPTAGAVVVAILIGDRSALPADVRERLQAAGTYHVIAISGGNIAILAALFTGVLLVFGTRGPVTSMIAIGGLLGYAAVITAGPSVWRATAMAVAYLAARVFDHRTPPLNAMAVAAALVACVSPLDVRDVGFALTFGATGAILEAARRSAGVGRNVVVRWAFASVVASLATEIVLLPIGASAFSRVTIAGLVLNLIAVPLMTIAQVTGLVVVACAGIDAIAGGAGFVAAAAARSLLESARVIDVVPWLALRVPPPPATLVVAYYVALGAALWLPTQRRVALTVVVCCGLAILTGVTAALRRDVPAGVRLTMFDVGQGEALLLETRDGRTLMIDAGGLGFERAAFDIGNRVLAPALWARGITRLDILALTHGDPDHIGGAPALVHDFSPRELWQGIPVASSGPLRALLALAAGAGTQVHSRLSGWSAASGGVHVRVVHPAAADWERLKVRNDDSLVLEVRYDDVALLLTGDIGAEVEQSIAAALRPAPIRILKVAHHGSRTSTSQALLDAWKPHVALISCGRENRFGHPAPDVMRRLESSGAHIYRTDRDGQITLTTDGHGYVVRTFAGGE
jgi:competence protein ComEC